MRLNPFSRPKSGRDVIPYDDSAEEDVARAKMMKERGPRSASRPRERFDDRSESNLSYAGGSSLARERMTSRSRGRSASTTRAKLSELPPGAQAVVRGRSKERQREIERESSSSPERVPRGRSGERNRHSAPARDASSSPEPEMNRRGTRKQTSTPGRSRSMRLSRAPSPTSDDEDSEPGMMNRSEMRRAASRVSHRSRPPPVAMRRGASGFVDEMDEFGPKYDRDHDGFRSSRSYTRRASAPGPGMRRPSYTGPERHRSTSRARAYSQGPDRSFREELPAEKPKKRGFRALFGFKSKQEDIRDDISDNSSIESFEAVSNVRDMPERVPIVTQPNPPVPESTTDNKYVVPKRETYANLYEYDNFPAIDRVPTAIGYQSDDSVDELLGDGPAKADADDKSVTSRYSVDVRSVRSAKLKHPGDLDSENENDDKYSQYLSGNTTNPIHSDDSDSCRPQWHHALDQDESDWYDDDDSDDEDGIFKKTNRTGKKYQVSSKKANKKKESKQAKGEPSGQDTVVSDLKEENAGDMIVANRSEEMLGNRVPRKKELEVSEYMNDDDETGLRRKRRIKRSGQDMEDEEDETIFSDDESGGETTQRNRKTKEHKKTTREKRIFMNKHGNNAKVFYENNSADHKVRNKKKSIFMNTHGKDVAKVFPKKGKSKGLVSRFKTFGRRINGYGSDSDESEISESARVVQNQSMFSEDPSSRFVDPTLTKLEEDERRESTATHNIIRNNRKEVAELDEMDEISLGSNAQNASCFPFSLAALNLGGGGNSAQSFCLFPGSAQLDSLNDVQLDDVQMQRLRDAKYDMENKPKVEVILQDLQDPLAEKYDQLEKAKRKQKHEVQKQRGLQEEIEKREREELLRMKREMRENEQKKLQMLQHRDALALQEAPDLKRGKNQSFVMDISDWVLNLDNDTPRNAKDTPRTNGRDRSSDPIEKLPFSTIEVPTITTADSGEFTESAAGSSWGRRKKRYEDDYSQPSSTHRHSRSRSVGVGQSKKQRKTNRKKKRGWFGRG